MRNCARKCCVGWRSACLAACSLTKDMPLDRLRIEFTQQLASQAAELLQPLYILVDPLVKDPLDTESELNVALTREDLCAKRQQLWSGCETLLINVSSTGVQLHQMPYLVCLPSPACKPCSIGRFCGNAIRGLANPQRSRAQHRRLDTKCCTATSIGGNLSCADGRAWASNAQTISTFV